MIEPLQRGQTYHIYSRGNNKENIFHERKNYDYFLSLYVKHIVPIALTYAYCLMRNHFHLLVRIKTTDELVKDLTGFENLSGLEVEKILKRKPSQSFANFFNAYTKAYNKQYERTGALFERPFGRKPVHNERYFYQLLIYIHQNPQKHGFVDDFRQWPYSSYSGMVSTKPSRLERDAVLQLFGGPDDYAEQHLELIDLYED
ncbi:MAG: hypothetical protein AAF902_12660 [Chloroflexota bacterium]